ncbi:hypothetical protein GCM10027431_08430 [Lysobacter rhizosphaerae]
MKSELKWGATLLALGLWLGVVLGANASEVDASKWGVYQRLAGTTRQPEDKGGYWMRWRWSQEGTELLEEYINPNKDKDTAAYTNTIVPGERTGELLLTSSVLGNKQWAGTLQSDGSVVFVGKGLLKWVYHVVLTPDGVLEVRRAKVRDGALVSDDAATPWTRYPPPKTDSPAEAAYAVTSPAPAPPASTASSAAPVETATPVVPVSSESPADRARRLFGPMAALAGQAFVYHYTTASFDLAEDGGVFILHGFWGTARLREGPDGSLQFLELPERTSRAIAHLESDGALVMELTYPGSLRVQGGTLRHTLRAMPDRPGFNDEQDWKNGGMRLGGRSYSYFDSGEYYPDTEANRSEQKLMAAEEQVRDERRRAEREAEDAAMFNAVMGGLQQGVDEAQYAQAQADARQEEMQAQLRHIEEQQTQLREARDAQEREAAQPVTYASAATTAPPSSPTPQAATTYRSLSGSGTGSWEHASGPSTLRSESQAGGEASTRNDPNTCLTPPEASPHRCGDKTGTKAIVANQCDYPVDVRICFMTDRGWNCQANYGLNPGRTWEPGWCNAINDQVFHSVRYSDSKDPLQNP